MFASLVMVFLYMVIYSSTNVINHIQDIPGCLWSSSIRIHEVHRIVISVDIRADAGLLFCQRVRGCPAGEVGVVHPRAEVLLWDSVQKELYT